MVKNVQIVQPLRSVQAVQRRKWVKDSDQDLFEVCARPALLSALGIRGYETFWSVCARLRSHV